MQDPGSCWLCRGLGEKSVRGAIKLGSVWFGDCIVVFGDSGEHPFAEYKVKEYEIKYSGVLIEWEHAILVRSEHSSFWEQIDKLRLLRWIHRYYRLWCLDKTHGGLIVAGKFIKYAVSRGSWRVSHFPIVYRTLLLLKDPEKLCALEKRVYHDMDAFCGWMSYDILFDDLNRKKVDSWCQALDLPLLRFIQ